MPEPDYSGVPCDFAIESRTSMTRLVPLTDKARDWVVVNMPATKFTPALDCYWFEAHEMKDVIVKVETSGLTVRRI